MTTKYTNNKILAFKKFVNAGIRQVSTGRDAADMEIVVIFTQAYQLTPSGCITFEAPL